MPQKKSKSSKRSKRKTRKTGRKKSRKNQQQLLQHYGAYQLHFHAPEPAALQYQQPHIPVWDNLLLAGVRDYARTAINIYINELENIRRGYYPEHPIGEEPAYQPEIRQPPAEEHEEGIAPDQPHAHIFEEFAPDQGPLREEDLEDTVSGVTDASYETVSDLTERDSVARAQEQREYINNLFGEAFRAHQERTAHRRYREDDSEEERRHNARRRINPRDEIPIAVPFNPEAEVPTAIPLNNQPIIPEVPLEIPEIIPEPPIERVSGRRRRHDEDSLPSIQSEAPDFARQRFDPEGMQLLNDLFHAPPAAEAIPVAAEDILRFPRAEAEISPSAETPSAETPMIEELEVPEELTSVVELGRRNIHDVYNSEESVEENESPRRRSRSQY